MTLFWFPANLAFGYMKNNNNLSLLCSLLVEFLVYLAFSNNKKLVDTWPHSLPHNYENTNHFKKFTTNFSHWHLFLPNETSCDKVFRISNCE